MTTDGTGSTGIGDRMDAPSRAGRSKRHALWLLAVPAVLYLLTPWVANDIHPIVLGMPFVVFYTIVVTILTPMFVWLVARMDPLYRLDADEPVPADAACGKAGGNGPTDAGQDGGEGTP